MSAAATTNDTEYYLKQQQLQHNDLSILRKPINTSVTGFLEVKKAYDDGTDEVCLFYLLFVALIISNR